MFFFWVFVVIECEFLVEVFDLDGSFNRCRMIEWYSYNVIWINYMFFFKFVNYLLFVVFKYGK